MTNVAIIGTGYVGLVTGVVLSEIGHIVTCIDIDEKKVNTLQQAKSPIFEPGLEELMVKNIECNRLFFTTNHNEAFSQADIIFIAVGTPQSETGAANLKYIKQAAKDIALNISRDTIVVMKSTVPVGTNDLVSKIISENLIADVQVEVVSNPEFLREGHAIHDTFHGDRIVIGAENEQAGDVIEGLFKPLNLPVIRTNRRSAEMIKYASNAFLAVKISYINEIANLCDAVGANVLDVASGMGMDHRVGRAFLNAGIGYGGSCFPKDTEALAYLSRENEINLSIVEAAIHANHRQSELFIQKVLNKYKGNLKGKTFGILGLSFKPNTDDLREAPSLKIISKLLELNAKIKVYDPIVKEISDAMYASIEFCDSVKECLTNVDATILVTEWQEFIDSNWEVLVQYPKVPLIYDGRNALSIEQLSKFGWLIEGVGQPITKL